MKLFSHDWCSELDAGNTTLDTHKESSDGGDRDGGEDAVRMGVRTKILLHCRLWVNVVLRNVFLPYSFLTQIIINSLIGVRSYVKW